MIWQEVVIFLVCFLFSFMVSGRVRQRRKLPKRGHPDYARIAELERRAIPPHCEDCELAEMTKWQRKRYLAARAQNPFRSYSLMFSYMGESMYARHRKAWISSGDFTELDRMKRHVSLYS